MNQALARIQKEKASWLLLRWMEMSPLTLDDYSQWASAHSSSSPKLKGQLRQNKGRDRPESSNNKELNICQ